MPKKILKQSFDKLLKSIMPDVLLLNQCSMQGGILTVQSKSYDLTRYKNIYIAGSGKAVVPMARAMQNLLKAYEPKSLLVGAYQPDVALENTTYIQSTHPLPSQKSIGAAKALVKFMNMMDEDDLYIYLLSGGSSALIELPIYGISLEDIEKTTQQMLFGGMSIDEINSIRRRLSKIKGGKLALESRAKGIVLVLSDVLGDDLRTIGSAPLYAVRNDILNPVDLLRSYNLFEKVPFRVQHCLSEFNEDGVKTRDTRVKHFILGSNKIVLQQAKNILQSKGILTKILDFQIQGDVKEVAQRLYKLASENHTQRVCYIAGGEATVVVNGSGKGGRNQHLALCFLDLLKGDENTTFLSAATDGVDGNSTAAGAIVDYHSYMQASSYGLDLKSYLENFDSNSFLNHINALLISGPTHNNLLDIVMIIVEPS